MNRLGVFIIALFLLIPSGVSAEWLMFGNGAERNFVADITERTIQKRSAGPSVRGRAANGGRTNRAGICRRLDASRSGWAMRS